MKIFAKFGTILAIFAQFYPQIADRLNRWSTDNNRPINRPIFDRLIGRLIGIGRTLLNTHLTQNIDIVLFYYCRYRGMDNLPATMTLGRRGHYASLRGGGHQSITKLGQHADEALLGPNMGQYATLSKQCKTLESSDFY